MTEKTETKYGPQNIEGPSKKQMTIQMTDTAQSKLNREWNPHASGGQTDDVFYTAKDIRDLLTRSSGTLFRHVDENYYHFLTTDSRILKFVEEGSDLVVVTQMHRHGLHYRYNSDYELVKEIPWELRD